MAGISEFDKKLVVFRFEHRFLFLIMAGISEFDKTLVVFRFEHRLKIHIYPIAIHFQPRAGC
jgi:hypothetical protein